MYRSGARHNLRRMTDEHASHGDPSGEPGEPGASDEPDGDDGSGTSDDPTGGVLGDDLGGLLRNLQRLVDPRIAVRAAQGASGAAWRSVTTEEPRVQVTAAVLAAIGLILLLPERVSNRPRWVLPTLAVLLLIGVFVAKSAHSARRTRELRVASLALIAVITLSNATSAGRLIVDLVQREGIRNPTTLLLTGASIWFTNVIVFGIWYWEFDRGGPVERGRDAPVSRLPVPADDESRARAARLGARLHRLLVRVVHERDRVQPDRRPAHDPMDEAHDVGAVRRSRWSPSHS